MHKPTSSRPSSLTSTSTFALSTPFTVRSYPFILKKLVERTPKIPEVWPMIFSWLVVWNIFLYIGNSNPNWLIFFRGVAIPPTSPTLFYAIFIIGATTVNWSHQSMTWLDYGFARHLQPSRHLTKLWVLFVFYFRWYIFFLRIYFPTENCCSITDC